MKEFMQYIATGCVSFTFSCVFYLFFSLLTIFPPFDERLAVTMLFISIGIMLLIYLTHLLPIQNPFTSRLLEVFVVLIVLLAAIVFFNMVPFKSVYTLYVLAMGLLTYAVVIIVLFTGDQADAQKINSAIRTHKKEKSNEENN